MITTIQTVKERLENVQENAKEFNAIIHVDEKRKNAFWSFKDMLDYDFDDYRLHLQDDIIIADNLKEYIPQLIQFMDRGKIELLSLFIPCRKSITKEYFMGKRVSTYRNYLGNMGVIFSKEFVEKLKLYVNISSQTLDDDIFIDEVLSRTNTKGFVHLPTLVQHDIAMKSILGHNVTLMYSNLFEKDFITKLNLK